MIIFSTWNCNMAFRQKAEKALMLNSDLLVIQEHEALDKIQFSKLPTSKLWMGDNSNKGIAIYSFCDYTLKLNESYNPNFKYIIPVDVLLGNKIVFTLLAVWTMQDENNVNQSYIGQVYYALKEYEKLLDDKTVIIGDFNWNVIWDKEKQEASFKHTADFLMQYEIKSLYHEYLKIQFGNEEHSTLYHRKNADKGYHIDYCFAGSFWIEKLKTISIGNIADWLEYSDHMPVSLYFN